VDSPRNIFNNKTKPYPLKDRSWWQKPRHTLLGRALEAFRTGQSGLGSAALRRDNTYETLLPSVASSPGISCSHSVASSSRCSSVHRDEQLLPSVASSPGISCSHSVASSSRCSSVHRDEQLLPSVASSPGISCSHSVASSSRCSSVHRDEQLLPFDRELVALLLGSPGFGSAERYG
jgi:hypothetical protein